MTMPHMMSGIFVSWRKKIEGIKFPSLAFIY